MSYSKACARFKEVSDLRQSLSLLHWDSAVNLPRGGGAARSDAIAALESIVHAKITEPDLGELLQSAVPDGVWQEANLVLMREQRTRAAAVPADLIAALARATSVCEQVWQQARPRNDWHSVEPKLREVVSLARQRAQALAEVLECDAYDALLDEHEPSLRRSTVDLIFVELAGALPAMIDKVTGHQEQPAAPSGAFSAMDQQAIARELMTAIGFDFERGRLDVSAHPFTSGIRDDTRITTRIDLNDPVKCIMAVIHETGHALYQQSLPEGHKGQPVGDAGGFALHESQSLLLERQVGRGDGFLKFLGPILERHAVGVKADWSAANLRRWVRHVKRGSIRVEADELTYPLHIILRYELEKALMDGGLSVNEIPEAWDSRSIEHLGLSTAGNYADGPLQDVHWFGGHFGYFPTYTVGAVMAAQFHAAADREIDGLDDLVSKGEFSELAKWLELKVHGLGRLKPSMQLLEEATGSPLGTSAFLKHLELRYLAPPGGI